MTVIRTTTREDATKRRARRHQERFVFPWGLELFISPCKGGHNFTWEDGHGKIWCGGWTKFAVPGNATVVAENYLKTGVFRDVA